ncbi:MAG: hypothetical protein J0H74_25735 [Chitinophagaceae bacterium]|nr:hypothetical protein [Chitinophagaceae bacterium]
MKTDLKILILLGAVLPVAAAAQQRILLAEQAEQRIAIADAATGSIVWEWKPSGSNVDSAHWKWFSNPSDVKPVYGGRYILINASGGGVALIRLADKKTLFYAYAGGNPHSSEIFPDGNIVVASSTGNYLTVYRVDTSGFSDGYSSKTYIDFGHNVVWDRKRQLLWSADRHQLKTFRYNFDHTHPGLSLIDSMPLPGQQSHDLFPTLSGDTLWLTNTTHVYKLALATRQLLQTEMPQKDVKSISSAAGRPTILSIPQEQWWTDEVTDVKGHVIFRQKGLKIYKARWLVINDFSYPPGDDLRLRPNVSSKLR